MIDSGRRMGMAGSQVDVATKLPGVRLDSGPAMKRVCVDGPVFDAYTVF